MQCPSPSHVGRCNTCSVLYPRLNKAPTRSKWAVSWALEKLRLESRAYVQPNIKDAKSKARMCDPRDERVRRQRPRAETPMRLRLGLPYAGGGVFGNAERVGVTALPHGRRPFGVGGGVSVRKAPGELFVISTFWPFLGGSVGG